MRQMRTEAGGRIADRPLRPVRDLVRLLIPASGWLTMALGFAVVASGVLPAAFCLAAGALVSVAAEAAGQGFGAVASGRLVSAGGTVIAIFVAQQIATPVLRTLAEALGRRVGLGLADRTMEATLRPAGIAHLEDPSVADRVRKSRTLGTGDAAASDAVVGLASLASRVLAVLGVAVVLAGYRWWIPVVIVILYAALGRTLMSDLRRCESNASGRADLAPRVGASHKPGLVGRAALPLGATVAMAITQGATLSLLARSAVGTQISLSQLATFALATFGLAALLRFDRNDLSLRAGSAEVPAVTALEQAISTHRFRLAGSRPADGLPRIAICLEDVWFGYPGHTEQILRNVDLAIPAGQSLAIVGERGAGKTALVKLLARLYDPSGGRILVDGIDLADLDPGSWHGRIAVTFEDFTHYPLSLAENVNFGAAESSLGSEALSLAARQAGLDEILDRLAEGWNTVLAPEGSRGINLSEGEWQKVALARALFALHAGAGVLVLDEPTANLDARSEAAFYDRFLELTTGATRILVSHRLATVRRADRIVLMDQGRVTEQGDHSSLMEANGRYAQLFQRQAARFISVEPDLKPGGGPAPHSAGRRGAMLRLESRQPSTVVARRPRREGAGADA